MNTNSIFRKTATALLLSASFAAFSGIVGCGSQEQGPRLYEVQGSVTLNSAPLQRGTITLTPTDGIGIPYGGRIENGKYSLKATPGEKSVAISSYAAVPGKKTEEGDTLTEQQIPEKYNSKTTLKVTVKDSGSNESSFVLESKKS